MKYIVPVHILANPSLAIAKSLIGTDDTVASGSETQDTNLIGMGMKQMGQSSFGGGSLNSAASRSSVARNLHAILCFGQ